MPDCRSYQWTNVVGRQTARRIYAAPDPQLCKTVRALATQLAYELEEAQEVAVQVWGTPTFERRLGVLQRAARTGTPPANLVLHILNSMVRSGIMPEERANAILTLYLGGNDEERKPDS